MYAVAVVRIQAEQNGGLTPYLQMPSRSRPGRLASATIVAVLACSAASTET